MEMILIFLSQFFIDMESLAANLASHAQCESPNSLIFIDSQVSDINSLIGIFSPQAQLMMLEAARDGIEQISEVLANFEQDIDSIAIISHAQAGDLQLGNAHLNQQTLAYYKDTLTGWSSALTDNADILLYGCNLAENQAGQALVKQLSHLTVADVAASTNLTGNQALGGDWELEYHTGVIEVNSVFNPSLADPYEGILHDEQHQRLLNLVPTTIATHVAVRNGSWFSASTWANRKVPDNKANVLIGEKFQVTYDNLSEARLNTVRVDGTLKFAENQNTKMLVDTLAVLPTGKLLMGSQTSPIQADKTAQVIFTSDKPINTILDPHQLGKGLVSHGQAHIYGADKLDHVALQGDALAGSSELVLALPAEMTAPQGWRVGDRLVLTGTDTNYQGSNANNSYYQDEVLTITQINGNRIRFTNTNITAGTNNVLRFNHQRPTGFNDLKIYVANLSRNIRFETENGANVAIAQRGHAMFLHNQDVVVKNANFIQLGRTDKSKMIDDPGKNIDGLVGYGTNVRGRYALHLHHTGTDPNSTPATLEGNVVIGSPGWGIVHHASYANLTNNIVFDVAGSAIVAEAGNEIGTWRNNLTIKTTGASKDGLGQGASRVNNFDFGFLGDGYWVQGASQVAMEGNIAVSTAFAGINIFGGTDGGTLGNANREVQTIAVANLSPSLQSIAKGTQDPNNIDVSAVPLRQLSNFVGYNNYAGISFWATLQNSRGELGFEIDGVSFLTQPAHRFFHVVDNPTLWSLQNRGLNLNYASQVEINGGIMLGDGRGTAILNNGAVTHLHLKKLYVENFDVGMSVPLADKDYVASKLENSQFVNLEKVVFDTSLIGTQKLSFSDYFKIVNTTFEDKPTNLKPVANFNFTAAGGNGVYFDGSTSSDSDSTRPKGDRIVSYAWDYNNDGVFDDYGRKVSHYFSQPGSYQVKLQVWDEQGATNTLTRTVTVQTSPYSNLLVNSNFSQGSPTFTFSTNYDLSSSMTANSGWVTGGWQLNNGVAVLSSSLGKGIGQSIQDNGIRRGQQTLSLDIKNAEGDTNFNQIVISVWGVNGEFKSINWEVNGPKAVGAIPMSATKLLEKNVGGSTFNWKNFTWDVDFGNGYQFIVFQVSPQNVNLTKNDYLAIDNVKLFSSNRGSSVSVKTNTAVINTTVTSSTLSLSTVTSNESYVNPSLIKPSNESVFNPPHWRREDDISEEASLINANLVPALAKAIALSRY